MDQYSQTLFFKALSEKHIGSISHARMYSVVHSISPVTFFPTKSCFISNTDFADFQTLPIFLSQSSSSSISLLFFSLKNNIISPPPHYEAGEGRRKKKKEERKLLSRSKSQRRQLQHMAAFGEKKKLRTKKRQGGRQMLCFVLSYLGSGSRAGALHCADNRDKLVNTNW